MLLKWAIVLLAKTLHAVYSETSSVFLLSSLSYVLHKTKELSSIQESAIRGSQIATIQSTQQE